MIRHELVHGFPTPCAVASLTNRGGWAMGEWKIGLEHSSDSKNPISNIQQPPL